MRNATRSFFTVFLISALAVPLARAQHLTEWATGLTKPVDFAVDPGSNDRVYIVEQGGAVRVLERDGDRARLLPEPFLSFNKNEISTRNWEQGLLGIAFDPAYADNKFVYVNLTDPEGATNILRFTADTPTRANKNSAKLILSFDQPYGNHNGGRLRFGPDGMLYIGTGDGGAANDPHNAGQRLDTLLGKMLRIDVTSEPDDGLNYAIPSDNPFVDRDDALPEIWSYGLRNPWAFEFDSAGRLWIADVGQNRFEEVHVQPADSTGGENYGWKTMEGEGEFKPGRSKRQDPERLTPQDHRDRGLEPPVFEYRHHPLASITGGFVYEGEAVESLKGRYVCADFMSGRVWSFELGSDALADDVVEHTRDWKETYGGNGPELSISGFGRDLEGEMYVLDLKAGRVLRVVD